MKIFIIFPFKNDFDLEYLTLFFFFYAKYTILYIFKIMFQFHWKVNVLEIYTEFC